jgi:hypothetical protein
MATGTSDEWLRNDKVSPKFGVKGLNRRLQSHSLDSNQILQNSYAKSFGSLLTYAQVWVTQKAVLSLEMRRQTGKREMFMFTSWSDLLIQTSLQFESKFVSAE